MVPSQESTSSWAVCSIGVSCAEARLKRKKTKRKRREIFFIIIIFKNLMNSLSLFFVFIQEEIRGSYRIFEYFERLP